MKRNQLTRLTKECKGISCFNVGGGCQDRQTLAYPSQLGLPSPTPMAPSLAPHNQNGRSPPPSAVQGAEPWTSLVKINTILPSN